MLLPKRFNLFLFYQKIFTFKKTDCRKVPSSAGGASSRSGSQGSSVSNSSGGGSSMGGSTPTNNSSMMNSDLLNSALSGGGPGNDNIPKNPTVAMDQKITQNNITNSDQMIQNMNTPAPDGGTFIGNFLKSYSDRVVNQVLRPTLYGQITNPNSELNSIAKMAEGVTSGNWNGFNPVEKAIERPMSMAFGISSYRAGGEAGAALRNSDYPKLGTAVGGYTFDLGVTVLAIYSFTPSNKITLYRGDRPGLTSFESYATEEGGYSYSESLIKNGNLDNLLESHAIDSKNPKSPFISFTTDIRVAEYFAGPNGQVYKVRVPRSEVIFNKFNSSEVWVKPGTFVPESEWLFPNRLIISNYAK